MAEVFHAAGNRVIAGRRPEPLAEVVAANPGMASVVLDVADPAAIRAFAERVPQDHPALNVLINNAGIMKVEDVLAAPDLLDCEATVATNLLGPIRLTAALLPHLRRQKAAAAAVNATSGLAFVPRADTPTYSATRRRCTPTRSCCVSCCAKPRCR